MANLRDFLYLVQPVVRLCPIPVLVNAVRNAVSDFCRTTRSWREIVTGDIVSGERLCALTLPASSSADSLMVVRVSGVEIPPMVGDISRSTDTGRPSNWRLDSSGAVELYPIPNESVVGGLEADAVLVPSYNASVVPDFILHAHANAIACGAIAEVAAMVGQPWANPQVALYNASEFGKRKARVRIAEIRGRSQGETIVIN